MFEKLKREFLILSLFFSLLVFVVTFVCVYSFFVRSSGAKNSAVLESALESRTLTPSAPQASSGQPSCLILILDREGTFRAVEHFLGNQAQGTDAYGYFQELSALCMAGSPYSSLEYDDRTWLYLREAEADCTRIAVMDITDQVISVNQLVLSFTVLGIIVVAVVLSFGSLTTERMIAPLDRVWAKQSQFLADASHELKTPLAIIYTNLELLSETDPSLEESKWFQAVLHQVSRMTKLVENLLYLARSEYNLQHTSYRQVDLKEVIEAVSTAVEAIIYEKQVEFHVCAEDCTPINGDTEQIEQLLMILLDNALKHTSVGGKIKLSLKPHGKLAQIRVANSGEPIPAEDLPYIFDRFYKVDASHRRDAGEIGGYGLGLSIAKTIVRQHRGMIKVVSGEGINTFVVEFPLPRKPFGRSLKTWRL